jgi:multiple sugar transport system permease protein
VSLIATRDQAGAVRTVRMGLASRQALIAYLFLFPAFVYFCIFFFYPIGVELWSSLQNNDSGVFAGLQNYIQAFQDPRVLNSFRVTGLFALGVTVLSIIIGLGLAILLDQPLRGRVILRACLLTPYITSGVIVGLMWRNILDPATGILNRVFAILGLPPQDWLSNYQAALPVLIVIMVWHGVGYTMILFLAGLQGIPPEYAEAASVDGATRRQRFRHITLPLLAPTTLFVSIISVISSLQAFSEALIITQGGPAEATRLYVYHVFNVAFNENNIAYASALTFLMFLAILLLTTLQLRIGGNDIEY